MPYIVPERRFEASQAPQTEGELNFAVTVLIDDYLQRQGLRYTTINQVLGALSGAKAEFYRRVAAPYEDRARARNGDVYTCDKEAQTT